ncbi:MAG: hypothetical protein AAGG75_20435 [Bacteroidota bacterium]
MKSNPQPLWQRIKGSPFFIKLLNWEYWPMWLTNIPVVLFWLYYAARARSLFFFSAVNPVIETGGVFGESKINILRRIPQELIPTTVFVPKGTSFATLVQNVEAAGLRYPLIAKPDVGERGLLVAKLRKESDLQAYFEQNKVAFLVQDFVDYPMEVSIMYYRMPEAERGTVSSVCVKEMLHVKGDGVSTLQELMRRKARARLQLERLEAQMGAALQRVPAKGERVELEPIGNHCRGTMFLNGNAHIDEQLHRVFDGISQQMKDMYYGRFDMKIQSMEELKAGRNFAILEFNGIASEPAHIYDPSYPLRDKYKDIFRHWDAIYRISQQQKARGVSSMSMKEAIDSLRAYFKYVKMIKA